jgi:hypothetical protein
MKTSTAVKLLLALSFVMWLPVAFPLGGWGIDVWHRAFLLAGVPRLTLLRYHQFPFWNPWASGGVPFLAYPISSFLSPAFMLTVAFGPVVGPKLRILLVLWVGLCGGYLLGRRFAPGRFAPFLCAFVYMFSSWYPLYMSHWHDEFIPFAYLPWLLLFYEKGLDDMRWCAGGGPVLALMIFEGGIYPVPYALLFLSLYALLEAVIRKRLLPIGVFLITVILGLALSGVKLLPMTEFLSRNPRPTFWKEPVLSWLALPRMFLGRDQISETNFTGAWLGWWEYGAYVGVLPVLLAVSAPFLARKRALPVGIMALLFFSLMFGDYGVMSPWHWIHRLPMFASLHDPVRFRVVLIFCLALMSAMAVSRLEEWVRVFHGEWPWALTMALGIATVAVVTDLTVVSAPIYTSVSTSAPLEPKRSGPFHQVRLPKEEQQGPRSFLCFLQNEGLINNYDGFDLPLVAVRAHNEPGYTGEAWFAQGMGTINTLVWSPNRLGYTVELTGADILVVNQRYDPGWKADDGRLVFSRGGIIALSVGPADKKINLRYVPPFFYPGCVLSVLGALAAFVVWKKWQHSPRPPGHTLLASSP